MAIAGSDASKATAVCQLHDALMNKRATTEQVWKDILDYVLPRKSRVLDRHPKTKGERRDELLFDATAPVAANLLANALHGLLTNPGGRFFGLRATQPGLQDDHEVQVWTDNVVDVLLQEVADSNWDSQAHEMYQDIITVGTGPFYTLPQKADNKLRFYSRHVEEVYIAENHEGIVDTFIREFPMSLRQLIQEFGLLALPEKVRRNAGEEKALAEEHNVLHLVQPREKYNPNKLDALNLPIASVYILKQDKHLLREGGFAEMPAAAPRWNKLSGEVYGRSPSWTALSDIQMINAMKRTVLKAAQRTAEPPFMSPSEGFMNPIQSKPGGVTFYKPRMMGKVGIQGLIQPLPVGDVRFAENAYRDIQMQIRQQYLNDQLDLKESPQMTATEANMRDIRQRRVMGPLLGRLNSEFLRPVIERCYGILFRQGRIPDPPPALEGQPLTVEYTSPIAQAQQMFKIESLNRALSSVLPLAEMRPDILDHVDFDHIARETPELYGVDPDILVPPDAVMQLRDARAKQQQAQQQMQMMMAMGQAGQTSADIQHTTAQTQAVQAELPPTEDEAIMGLEGEAA